VGISRPDIPFTYEDYKTLAASTDERHELIDGGNQRIVQACHDLGHGGSIALCNAQWDALGGHRFGHEAVEAGIGSGAGADVLDHP